MIQIDRLHWITDAPLTEQQARVLGQELAQALERALPEGGLAMSIGELALQLPRHAVTDASAFAQVAQSAARQIATAATQKEGVK